MIDEGYIKFNCEWIETGPISKQGLKEIKHYRDQLYQQGLVGVYENGVGFGNISVRQGKEQRFIITGTQTGHVEKLGPEGFVRVLDYKIDKNYVHCEGPLKASSESLTHAMVYEINPSIGGVIHIHHRGLWTKLLHQVPTTSQVPYGTPEMAHEVKRLYLETDLKDKKIFAMSGHEEGIVTFGRDLGEAHRVLMRYFKSPVGTAHPTS